MQFHPSNYLDFHTHRLKRSDRGDITEIVSVHLGKETDKKLYTIGKHPWWTEEVLSSEEIQVFETHFENENCLAMGEMGLDKLKGVSLEKQVAILKSQLDVARNFNQPVIIHCVRAFDQLLKVKNEYPEIKKWCIHGYARHKELAKQLLNNGFCLSLMPQKMTDKYVELVKYVPLDRLFLETDSMAGIYIEDIYLQVSKILNVSIEALKRQMAENATTFFYE